MVDGGAIALLQYSPAVEYNLQAKLGRKMLKMGPGDGLIQYKMDINVSSLPMDIFRL